MKKLFGVIVFATLVVTMVVADERSTFLGRWFLEAGQPTRGNIEDMELLTDGTGIVDSLGIKWRIENSRFYVTHPLQAQSWRYEISGSTLILVDNNGKRLTYKKGERQTKFDEKTKYDEKLNGTWISELGEVTYNNGVWEMIQNNGFSSKGTYITNNGKISSIMTHFSSGGGWDRVQDSFWSEDYSINGKTLTLKNEYGEEDKYTKK